MLLLIAAAIVWSFGGLLIKLIGLGPMATAGARSAVAAVVIWAFSRGGRGGFSANLLLGAVAYAGTVVFFVMATKMTTAANAILLQYTAPVYVAILSPWLLRERITRIDWATIVLAMGGMTFFFLDRLSTDGMIGNVLAIVSGVFFALTVIALRREPHGGSSMRIVLVGNLLAALVGLPALATSTVHATDLLWLLLLGVGQLGLGYIFFVRGVRYVPAIEAALIPILEPLLNPIWVMLFYGEAPSEKAIIGGSIVIASVTARGIYKARVDRGRRIAQGGAG